MHGVPAEAQVGSGTSLPPSLPFTAAAADIKPCQRASPELSEPAASSSGAFTLTEFGHSTVGDTGDPLGAEQEDSPAREAFEIRTTALPSECKAALVAAPAVLLAPVLPLWRVQPGVDGTQITTGLGMEEATHHRRQLLKALALQAQGESNPDIDLCVSMLLVGLLYRTLAPGVLEELSLVEVVNCFLKYPDTNVVANAKALLHAPPWVHHMRELSQDAIANGSRATPF